MANRNLHRSAAGRRASIDVSGAPVSIVRIDSRKAGRDVPALLKEFIDAGTTRAWEDIKRRIDYLYGCVDLTLTKLNEKAAFSGIVQDEVKRGKKLLFKPNLVVPSTIDWASHGEAMGSFATTHWTFVAAVMRWFHDRLDLPYHDMVLGEASTQMSAHSAIQTRAQVGHGAVTTEAVMEGKYGDQYGGWGFYFARKYLVDTHPPDHKDNPMGGYEESVGGEYLPPGRAGNRLMVYDLNFLGDDNSRGRAVPVPDGANFNAITLHKAIVGGNPDDPDDMRDYPGCVLINIPRLRVHGIDLITNAIKNIGIGLYPMGYASEEDGRGKHWKYAYPFQLVPGMKAELPHAIWIPELDEETCIPLKDSAGNYKMRKTAGLNGTMIDAIKAVQNQNVHMVHVVDASEMMNTSMHGVRTRMEEGYVFSSLNPVALDLLCARYLFTNVPMQEAERVRKERRLPTDFLQMVPIPTADGNNIVNCAGYDSPVSRCLLYEYAEKRGLGVRQYHAIGWDRLADVPLASRRGHLGAMKDVGFEGLVTPEFYTSPMSFLWFMQSTALGYIRASDRQTGSSYCAELMQALDENGDGVIDISETGKKGYWKSSLRLNGLATHMNATEEYGSIKGQFISLRRIKYSNTAWNDRGVDSFKESHLSSACAMAFRLSMAETESSDPFSPSITYGKGKWPSLQFASHASILNTLYGPDFPQRINLLSLYGFAFQYADMKYNGGAYTGKPAQSANLDAVNNYATAVSKGAPTLKFVLYVPKEFSGNTSVPNVRETEDPSMILTAYFDNAREVW